MPSLWSHTELHLGSPPLAPGCQDIRSRVPPASREVKDTAEAQPFARFFSKLSAFNLSTSYQQYSIHSKQSLKPCGKQALCHAKLKRTRTKCGASMGPWQRGHGRRIPSGAIAWQSALLSPSVTIAHIQDLVCQYIKIYSS